MPKLSDTKLDVCPVCAGALVSARITHQMLRGDRVYIFEHVPALVCSSCDEVFLDDAVLDKMDHLIDGGRPKAKVQTPVFDLGTFAAAA